MYSLDLLIYLFIYLQSAAITTIVQHSTTKYWGIFHGMYHVIKLLVPPNTTKVRDMADTKKHPLS